MKGNGRRAGVALIGTLLGALTVVGVSHLAAQPVPKVPTHQSHFDIPVGAQPGVERGSLEQAQKGLPFAVLTPSHDSTTTLGRASIYFRPESAAAGPPGEALVASMSFEYESGLRISESQATSFDYPTSEFYEGLGDGFSNASVSEVNGAPAFIMTGSRDDTSVAAVDVILQGVRVQIVGLGGESDQTVLGIAASLPAQGSGTPTGP
ncbi:MAG: hypothetical protein QOI81_403 [Actinomycetota bacterium]|nr:hypothetical protein [Actinomycetota bacterium]